MKLVVRGMVIVLKVREGGEIVDIVKWERYMAVFILLAWRSTQKTKRQRYLYFLGLQPGMLHQNLHNKRNSSEPGLWPWETMCSNIVFWVGVVLSLFLVNIYNIQRMYIQVLVLPSLQWVKHTYWAKHPRKLASGVNVLYKKWIVRSRPRPQMSRPKVSYKLEPHFCGKCSIWTSSSTSPCSSDLGKNLWHIQQWMKSLPICFVWQESRCTAQLHAHFLTQSFSFRLSSLWQ